jgi:predicted O-methyltransferase YrrM
MNYHNGIPGWFNFSDFYDWVVRQAPETARFVEVGTFFGASAAYLQERIRLSGKNIKLDLVDTFDTANLSEEAVRIAFPLGGFRKAFEHFTEGKLGKNVTVCQQSSVAHAKSCRTGSLDFVFLDGCHVKREVLLEIGEYLHKIRAGGILAGHDIEIPDVVDAVREIFGEKFERFGRSVWYVRL